MYYDPWLFGVLAAMLLSFLAQSRMKKTYSKYMQLPASAGMAAREVAARLLISAGCSANITEVSGALTDHYDPKNDIVGLSSEVYRSGSVAAMAVAAHEIGHVRQHQDGYFPIKLRNAILPVAQIGSTFAPFIVIIGLVMGLLDLAMIGVYLFGAVLAFQLITLPVEFNASARALSMLSEGGYINGAQEEEGVRKVLRAAAMTYVVAALATLVTMLRFLSFTRRSRR